MFFFKHLDCWYAEQKYCFCISTLWPPPPPPWLILTNSFMWCTKENKDIFVLSFDLDEGTENIIFSGLLIYIRMRLEPYDRIRIVVQNNGILFRLILNLISRDIRHLSFFKEIFDTCFFKSHSPLIDFHMVLISRRYLQVQKYPRCHWHCRVENIAAIFLKKFFLYLQEMSWKFWPCFLLIKLKNTLWLRASNDTAE